MNNNKIAINSIASDLKRVALGLQRNSPEMAECFFREAVNRKREIDFNLVPDYIADIIRKIESLKAEKNKDRVPEDCLMYSTLLQNFANN